MTKNHQKLVWQKSGTLRRVPCPELHIGAEFKGVWQYFVQMLIKSCREPDYFILNFSFLYRCLVPGPHTACLTLHISEPQGFSFPDLANAHSCSPVKAINGKQFLALDFTPWALPSPSGSGSATFCQCKSSAIESMSWGIGAMGFSDSTLKQHLMDISEE